MPIYGVSAGSISGDFWFSDEEWKEVEARAALRFEQESRDKIHDANVGLLLGVAAENNRVTTDDLKSVIEALRDGGRLVAQFLVNSSPPETATHVALSRVWRHLPKEVRLSLIQPLLQLVEASNRAIYEVEQLSEPGTPGHKFTAQIEDYVERLSTVFKGAGGNPGYGTRRLPNRDKHGSKFTDFLETTYEILFRRVAEYRESGQHSLPSLPLPKSSEAWAAILKRMNMKRKSANRQNVGSPKSEFL